MSCDVAIRVRNLSKCYEIYERPSDRLKQSAYPHIQRFLGKAPKKYHKDFWALKDVSFNINKGETVGIIGSNGSGKSTLLQLICGTLNATSGVVETNGRIAALLELGSGFNPEFTGRENIYMNAAILGLTREETDARYDAIVEFSGIAGFIEQPVKTYSSGMYVRLAFSVATNVSPDILIVDEALAVGDAAFQAKCMRRFDEFRRRGVTILLVTHDLGSVLQFSSKCILLDAGIKQPEEEPKLAVDSFKKLLLSQNIKTEKRKQSESSRVNEMQSGSWSSNYALNSEGCEIYGNGNVTITDFGIFDNEGRLASQKLLLGERYTFRIKYTFHDKTIDPIFTITFRDLTGREIAGTNTNHENVSTGEFSAGDEAQADFEIDTRLAPGTYLLTFACSGFERDEFVVHERLYHILLVEVIGTEQIVGYFALKAAVTVQRNGVPLSG